MIKSNKKTTKTTKSKKIRKYKLRTLKGYGTCVRKTSNKYINRKSPPYSANKCCNETKEGNDRNIYISKPNKNNICKWIKKNKSFQRKNLNKITTTRKSRKSRLLYPIHSSSKFLSRSKLKNSLDLYKKNKKIEFINNTKQTLLNKNININNNDIVMYTTSYNGGDLFNVYIISKYNYAIITISNNFFQEDQDMYGNPLVKLNKNNLIENIKSEINTNGIIIDNIISVDPVSKNKKTRHYDRFPDFKNYKLRITYNKLFTIQKGASILFELTNDNYDYLYICESIYKFNTIDINKDISKITNYLSSELDYYYAISHNYIYLLLEKSVFPKLNYEMWKKENNYSNNETNPYQYFYSMTKNKKEKSTKEFILLYQNNLDHKMIFNLFWYN
jgi:hypothetical protein